jgi:hypothetical protein
MHQFSINQRRRQSVTCTLITINQAELKRRKMQFAEALDQQADHYATCRR